MEVNFLKTMASRLLHVAGFDKQVTQEVLHAAFIPFGDILEIIMPQSQSDARMFNFLHVFVC
jgi:hypothetical protein